MLRFSKLLIFIIFTACFSLWAIAAQPPSESSADFITESINYLKKNAKDKSAEAVVFIEQNRLFNLEGGELDSRIALLSHSAEAFQFQGNQNEAWRYLNKAESLLNDSLKPATKATVYLIRAGLFFEQAQYPEAQADFNKVISLYAANQVEEIIGHAYQGLGETFLSTSQHNDALNAFHKSQFIFKAIKDPLLLAHNLGRFGSLHRSIGAFDKALEYNLESLQMLQRTGLKTKTAIAFNNTGIIFKDLGRYQEAIDMHLQSLQLKQEIGYERGMVYSYNNLGETYRLKGELEQALAYLRQAEQLALKLNNRMLLGSTYLYRARIAYQQYELDKALGYLNSATAIYRNRNSLARLSEAEVEFGRIYAAQGNNEAALTHFEDAIAMSTQARKNVVTFAAYEGLIELLRQTGEYEQALNHYLTYQGLKSALQDQQSQRRLESLIVENQLFNSQQQLELAQQQAKLKQAELEKNTIVKNLSLIGAATLFTLLWLLYRKYVHKRSAQLEKQSRLQIEQSEQRLNLALWGGGDVLWDIDMAKRVIRRQNVPATSRLPAKIEGAGIESMEEFVHPDDYQNLASAFQKHLEGKTPFFEASYRVMNTYGEWIWLLDRGKVVEQNDQGQAVRIAGTQRDISKLKSHELALNELNAELEQKVQERTIELKNANVQLGQTINKLELAQDSLVESEKNAALGGIVAGLAHEINTPLGTAITAASHLKSETIQTWQSYENKTLSNKQLQLYLKGVDTSSELIESGVGRAGDLVERFKQLAVKDDEQEFVTANINEVVSSSFRFLINNQKQPLAVEPALNCEADLELTTNLPALMQMFTILIENAIAHAQAEGLELTCKATRKSNSLHITFEDNGIGIAADLDKKIFEPFYTTRRNDGHTGLGLHIMFNLVNQVLKGKVSCYGVSPSGLGFDIELRDLN